MDYEEAEAILQVYTMEEILELNDLSPEEALCFLVNQEFISLLEPRPL